LQKVRKLLICTILVILSELSFADTKEKLKSALETYENSLFQLSIDGSALEKAAAIKGLAELGSARYEDARNQLLDEKEFVIKKALLESIPLMADFSVQSKEFIVDCLKSDAEELVALACNTFATIPDLTFEFRNLWNSNSLFFLWKNYGHINNCGSVIGNLIGIGITQPWNDPVWQEISQELQKALLERAGTRKSIEVLKQISRRDEPHYFFAEPVDPVALNEVVLKSDNSLKLYAAQSLIKAKDPTYVQRVQTKIQQLLGEGVDKNSIQIDGLDPYWTLPFFSDDEVQSLADQLYKLAEVDKQWILRVNGELLSRRKSVSFDEITSKNFPHASENDLRSMRFSTIIQQRLYSKLPSILSEMLANKSELYVHYFLDLKFLSSLPESIAHKCFVELKSHLADKVDYPYFDRPQIILQIMGLFARGDDQESLWQKFIHTIMSDMTQEISIPVIWGFNQRSALLRKKLGSESRYLPSTNEIYDLGNHTKVDCGQPSYILTTLPFELPVTPEKIWKYGLTFAQKVYEIYGHDQRKLISDFLTVRNIQLSESDFLSSVLYVKDKRFVIRMFLIRSLKGNFPGIMNSAYPIFLNDINDFFKTNYSYLEAYRGFKPVLLGPRLSGSEERKLDEMLKQAKDIAFEQKLYYFYNPVNAVVTPALGPPDTEAYPAQPFDFFVQDASKYLDQLNRLKTATDDNLRYEVLWALWMLTRDPKILETWMNDATQKDTSATGSYLKARALFVLQKIRYKPSTKLFPPLLHDEKPLLRQTALFGVQSFKLYETYDDVKRLLSDPDEAVSETAIATLGHLKSEDAREILIQHLKGTYRQAFVANAALKKYRSFSDIDRIAEYLKDPNLSTQQRIMLFDVVSELTYRPEPQWKYWDTKFENVPAESISKWLEWWKENKSKPRSSWYETADKNLALTLGISTEAAEYQKELDIDTQNALASIFENFVPAIRKGESVDEAYKILLNYSDEDFGNPGVAFCSAKDRILEEWIQWARIKNLYAD
jgi:HEAT repeats